MTAAEYLGLLRTRAGQLLAHGRPVSYPRSLASVTQLAIEKIADDDPAAADLAHLCAFMAAEPIPEDLIIHAAGQLPGALAVRAADPLAWRRTVAHLTRQSLARVDHRGVQLHRLTQAILRDCLSLDQAAAARSRVEAILAASHPGDSADPATWPRWARLMPHLLAIEPGSAASAQIRVLACDACWYLQARGDARGSHDLADRFYRQWRERLGADEPRTMMMARVLGSALRRMGRYDAARGLDEDTMARDQRLRGDDHPDTLASAHYLALDLRNLGEVEAACNLDRDTLARRRRVLGQDHPRTLASANSLAIDLRELGEVQAARDLHEDTLARRRRVQGEDHPDTLDTAHNLAIDLNKLSEKHEVPGKSGESNGVAGLVWLDADR